MKDVQEVREFARQIRIETLKMLTGLGFGHYGGSMSVVETLAVLYGDVMRIDPKKPDWQERDYFVLSKGHANRVFCILGDGELNEGQCWEAFQFIAHHNLNNLTLFIDYNKQQLDGLLDEVIKPFDLAAKFSAFGFDVLTIKGDDVVALQRALTPARQGEQRPLVVVLDSVKGQGVKYLEQLANSHHLRLTPDVKLEIENAIAELEAAHV